ncbi:MAG: NADH-quinone oxidoreductase subunit N, partial [Vicinamibacterales bacterium]|nr:NADH-quinone oxidoreductase subunit N [Vicinamibacterales bacterium]
MPAGFSALDFYFILPEILLTCGALVLLMLSVIVPKQDGVLLGVALTTIAVTLLAVFSFAGLDETISRGLLAIDGFATFFKVVVLLSAAITVLMSAPYLRVEGLKAGEYYFLILCATVGMMFMSSGLELITLFIGLETMAMSFYVLAGYLKPNPRSNEAAVKYFLLGAFSLGILLYGMSLLYGATGTTRLAGIAAALAGQETSAVLVLAVILVGAGMGFKIAAVPFHMWAPDVYEGAPTPVTAFLSVGSKAASFAMLLRIFVEGLPALGDEWRTMFWVLAVITMTVGNIAALTQSNLKRMLAYSSIAHAGYLLIGVVVGTERGVAAMLVYLGVYLFMQLGAFAIVTAMRRSDIIGDELKDLNGLFKRSPAVGFAMLCFMLSLGGIPPTAGFMGKMWLFGAAIDAGEIWLVVIAVVNSAISAYYYLRVVVFMWINEDEPVGSPITLGPAMALALGIAVLGTLVLGVYPQALFSEAQSAAATLDGISSAV